MLSLRNQALISVVHSIPGTSLIFTISYHFVHKLSKYSKKYNLQHSNKLRTVT